METTKNEFDFLNCANDSHIRDTVCHSEPIFFSAKITKINGYGLNQERNIIITDKAIYNLKKSTCKRIIKLKVIRGITVSKISDEFVIHCLDEEYDYYYSSQKKKTIIEIISKYLSSMRKSLKTTSLPKRRNRRTNRFLECPKVAL